MTRMSRDQVLMGVARLWSGRSTCSRAQVGAVVSRDGRTLVTGYNGAPAGMKHCFHEICSCSWDSEKCPKHSPCLISVHGEANVVAFAARHGVALNGADLHTTRLPCINCAMLIINSGIIRVVYDETHRETGGFDLLAQAGLEVVKYDYAQ